MRKGVDSTATVRSFNKVTGITYVYDSHKIWSKTEKKYKTVRKLIGKIDKETGKVVPTGPRGRPKRESREPNMKSNTTKTPTTTVPVETAASDVQAMSTTIAELKIENSLLINL